MGGGIGERWGGGQMGLGGGVKVSGKVEVGGGGVYGGVSVGLQWCVWSGIGGGR